MHTKTSRRYIGANLLENSGLTLLQIRLLEIWGSTANSSYILEIVGGNSNLNCLKQHIKDYEIL